MRESTPVVDRSAETDDAYGWEEPFLYQCVAGDLDIARSEEVEMDVRSVQIDYGNAEHRSTTTL